MACNGLAATGSARGHRQGSLVVGGAVADWIELTTNPSPEIIFQTVKRNPLWHFSASLTRVPTSAACADAKLTPRIYEASEALLFLAFNGKQ